MDLEYGEKGTVERPETLLAHDLALNLRLAGGIHRTGLCISRRLVENTV